MPGKVIRLVRRWRASFLGKGTDQGARGAKVKRDQVCGGGGLCTRNIEQWKFHHLGPPSKILTITINWFLCGTYMAPSCGLHMTNDITYLSQIGTKMDSNLNFSRIKVIICFINGIK